MKKLHLITAILLFCSMGVYAQAATQTTLRLLDEDLPTQVLAALEVNHPGLLLPAHLTEPADPATVIPVPKEKDRLEKNTPSSSARYVVYSNGKNYRKREVYNSDGILLYSKEVIRDKALPRPILNYIGKAYNGWQVQKVVATKTIFWNSPQENYYQVLLGKDKQSRKLMLDEQGKLYVKKPV